MDLTRRMLMVPLALIDEPKAPVRATMADDKMAELQESMTALGLLNPIRVTEANGRYEVRSGHRRLLAARNLGWKEIRALVVDGEGLLAEAERIHENAVREEVNTAEEAVYFNELLEKYHLDEAGLCNLVKRTPDYVAGRLALLRGAPEVFDALLTHQISFAVARELNRLQDEEALPVLLDSAIRSGSASRVVAVWVTQANQRPPLATPDVSGEAPPAPANEAAASTLRCEFCDGDKMPWLMKPVFMHTHCWDTLRALIKEVERQAKEDASDKTVGAQA